MAFFTPNKRNVWGNVNMTEPLGTKLLSENIAYKLLDSVYQMRFFQNGSNCLTHHHRYQKRGF